MLPGARRGTHLPDVIQTNVIVSCLRGWQGLKRAGVLLANSLCFLSYNLLYLIQQRCQIQNSNRESSESFESLRKVGVI